MLFVLHLMLENLYIRGVLIKVVSANNLPSSNCASSIGCFLFLLVLLSRLKQQNPFLNYSRIDSASLCEFRCG